MQYIVVSQSGANRAKSEPTKNTAERLVVNTYESLVMATISKHTSHFTRRHAHQILLEQTPKATLLSFSISSRSSATVGEEWWPGAMTHSVIVLSRGVRRTSRIVTNVAWCGSHSQSWIGSLTDQKPYHETHEKICATLDKEPATTTQQ